MDILLNLLKVLAVLLFPIAIAAVSERFVLLVADKEFKTVPILMHLAKLHGLLVGAALIYTNFSGRYFDLERLFMTDSPWNISFAEFLLERGNVFTYAVTPFVDLLADPSANLEILAFGIALVTVPAICVGIALRVWPPPIAWRAIVACGIMAVTTVWMTVYLVALTFWGLYLLNFWALAIIAAYYQYRRYHNGPP